MADPFASLNSTIARAFGGSSPVTYTPSGVAPSVVLNAVLDTPREMDESVAQTYLEIWLDGNDPILLAAGITPATGDLFTTAAGYQYLIHRVDVDIMNGVNLVGRLKGAPPTVPDPYASRAY